MSTKRKILIALLVLILAVAALGAWLLRGNTADYSVSEVTGTEPLLADPEAESFPTVAIADPIGWKDGEVPAAAEGLAVSRFADGLDHPRVIHTLPNGDVLVTLTRAPASEGPGGIQGWIAGILFEKAGSAGASPEQLVLLRDSDGDGAAETRKVLRDDLESPSGIEWADGKLYVANHNAVLSFDYELGADAVTGKATKLMDLPPGGGHWMRNLALSPDGSQLYVAVGSVSNIGEKGMEIEKGRAAIHELDVQSGKSRLFATGLRNPNGLAFNPWSGELWTTVNERDMLGSDLVPDYLTNVPVGVNYGWPWFYYRDNVDDRVKAPMPSMVAGYVRRPEYALGPHVAALGMVFTEQGSRMGDAFGNGAFIARHGSWNRKPPSGYDLIYVAFDERGNPQGKPVEVLGSFLTSGGDTRGRPTWVDWAADGALLMSDDTAGIIWRVIAANAKPATAPALFETESLPPRRNLVDPRSGRRDQ
ncbi:sorbosone dehydrogenase family protein [Altererythrobacter aquiaggeris]|uniref:PQQ-dependent sugar dehydrogenase n=1 Tax=Aestuarierythrobacter aquiaggeris TaxID=1898396 RepID=UPI00301AC273